MPRENDLGTCCRYCFLALNGSGDELDHNDAALVRYSGMMLSALADREKVGNLRTGGNTTLSMSPCSVCENPEHGDRWGLFGKEERGYYA